jgi:dihydroorotate dehydrogenase electron transfer subunit
LSTAAEPHTLAPPERRIARVVANEEVGAYRLVSALDLEGPRDPRPGQFYMLAAAERWGGGEGDRPYLPRAFSYARATPLGDAAPGAGAPSHDPAPGVRLDFLLEEVGPGTERLAELSEGEGLALVGPLGVGFRVRLEAALLVGGGIGAAPLLCLRDELPGAPVLLGFRTAAHAEAAALFRGDVALATDDGSAGRRALVTELLRERLDREPRATVYACGPPAMLEAVRTLCAERAVGAQLALESGMACGFGACFGCVVPTRGGYVRICVDGPVIDAEALESALFPGAGH